jgi:NADPH-dependent F420 reductase
MSDLGSVSKRKIAIIGGTGDQGFGLALRLAKAGEHVIIGSREKSKGDDAARKIREILGEPVEVDGAENSEAVAVTNLIILSVPFAGQVDILKSIKKSFKDGDILVNVTVPLATAIKSRATKTLGVWEGSAAELTASMVPAYVRVISAFNNVGASALQDMSGEMDCDVLVCGDDQDAKRVVMEMAEKVPNIRAIDVGGLDVSRIVEQITALLISINIKHKVKHAGIRITGITFN